MSLTKEIAGFSQDCSRATFQIVTSAPLFLIALIVFVIPESPRWLLKTGKYDEFVKIVQRAAKFNKVGICKILRCIKVQARGAPT